MAHIVIMGAGVGGMPAAYEMRAAGGDYAFRRLPDLPKPIGYAAGSIAGGRFFVIGGVSDPSSTAPSREVWSLDLAQLDAGWAREADLPGPGLLHDLSEAYDLGVKVMSFKEIIRETMIVPDHMQSKEHPAAG